MRKYIILIAILTLGCHFNSLSQTLDDYLKEAGENNPGLKAKYFEFEASLQKVAQVNALPDPTITFGYFISPVETRVGPQKARINLTQMFPWFGTLNAKKDVSALMADATYQEFVEAKNELFYKVKQAYYPLYELGHILQLQKDNLEILNTYKQLSLSAYQNGKSSMVDVIRTDIMIENAETEIKLLKDKKKPLEFRFNKLLNRADSLSVLTQDSLTVVDVSMDYRKDSLLSKNPKLASIDLKIQSANARGNLAKKEGLPKFGIGLDYVIVDQRTDMDIANNGKNVLMPMVSASIPIFRGKYKASVAESQLSESGLRASKENLVNNLETTYEMAMYDLERSKDLVDLYAQQIHKTQQAIELLLVAYSNSGKDFDEILRMQQELLKYQIASVKSTSEFYTALAQLDYLTAKRQ